MASPVLLSMEANQNRKGQKRQKTHCLHPQRGTIFFGYFLCSYKESISLSARAKKHNMTSKEKYLVPVGRNRNKIRHKKTGRLYRRPVFNNKETKL